MFLSLIFALLNLVIKTQKHIRATSNKKIKINEDLVRLADMLCKDSKKNKMKFT